MQIERSEDGRIRDGAWWSFIDLRWPMAARAFVLEPDPLERSWIQSALGSVVKEIVFLGSPAALLGMQAFAEDCLVACTEPDAGAVLELVRELRRRGSRLPSIVYGPHTAFRTAVEIARMEATDFLERPFSARQLRIAVARACAPRA
ncbi:hypothetical protein WKW79_22230 [Variovorax robiniae]|uniref:Response regulatory domain-containing protein n=1 Tax=Variovorax robiniae TaxID=1836199 RepID=A0ABU8XBS4_9BURK